MRTAFAGIVGAVIRRIGNHSSKADGDRQTAAQIDEIPDDFYRQKLREALGAGVEALNDPEIERKVEAYFRENPSFSRDAVHVAAVACRFKKGAGHGGPSPGDGIAARSLSPIAQDLIC